MKSEKCDILLADDDLDDCFFFQEVLIDLSISANLKTVSDGVKLMQYLQSDSVKFPDIIFIDLNMPRKSGIECIAEIKSNDKLKNIPVVMYSTSLDTEVINMLYKKGALYYMQKQGEFSLLKKTIQKVITLFNENGAQQPSKENFIIKP